MSYERRPAQAARLFSCMLLAICLGLPAASGAETAEPPPVPDTGTSFWHLCLLVRDMERMHDFYTRVLGLTQTTDLHLADAASVLHREGMQMLAGLDGLTGIKGTHVTVRHYSVPGMQNFLELLHFPDHPAEQVDRALNKPLGWNHLGLEVKDLDTVVERIRNDSEGTMIGGPSVLWGQHRYVLLKDPEGNMVELYERAADSGAKVE